MTDTPRDDQPKSTPTLMIGGPRNRDTIDLREGTEIFTDLGSGTRYGLVYMFHVKASPLTGEPVSATRRGLLVHETVPSQQHAQAMLSQHLINEWIKEGGEPSDIPEGAPTIPRNQNGRTR